MGKLSLIWHLQGKFHHFYLENLFARQYLAWLWGISLVRYHNRIKDLTSDMIILVVLIEVLLFGVSARHPGGVWVLSVGS